MKHVADVVAACIAANAHKATKYLSEREVVTATRRLFKGKIQHHRQNIDIVLKIGRPNYADRKFIKDCIAAGVSFPVRKIQFKFPPKRRK